ncbi:hypothetical protein D9757_001419 [Collybiopsis confluens]|uniref:C2H2-type domain-containing protein n=1 Tax=Collybiopsis confluens TaxID=2823264 RepID=A0A8H5HZE2_9AGAR|nr:hypothetical protein D9757_001419 [Collybiopsis confluens]
MQTHYYSDDPSLLLLLQNASHYPVLPSSPSFSGGSPPMDYLDPEYPYLIPSTSSALPTMTDSATGLSVSRLPFAAAAALPQGLYPEDTLAYQYSWNIPSTHGRTPSLPESSPLGPDPSFKTALYPSPTPKLPTPSEMAILMRPSRAVSSTETSSVPPPLATRALLSPDPLLAGLPSPEEEFTLARERKHACSMCHKRFDRPSTLRKHLLVHTGEKAFQCETCGRRFGVASNLNRHVRRCILKPVNTMRSSSAISNTAGTGSSSESNTPASSTSLSLTHRIVQPRQPRAQTAASQHKRRRRAPSPSRWIPESLRGYILEGLQKTTPIPLPPVKPSVYEERNSWDENVGDAPYHPREWDCKPRLPGPGVHNFLFGGRDVQNIGNVGREQILGRVMVF